jgi:DNA-binding transcriptional MerR regulator
MRIGELSAASGVPLPTVKYYLREGLLPAGRRTARNQADYGPEHLARLRLVRALVEVGGLSVADTRRVLEAADDPELPLDDVLGEAHQAVTNRPTPARPEPAWSGARELVLQTARGRGWRVSADAPALDRAADAAAAVLAMDVPEIVPLLDVYAEVAENLAEREVAAVMEMGEQADIVRGVVVGTVLGEQLLGALRLLAQRSVTLKLLDPEGVHCPDEEGDTAGGADSAGEGGKDADRAGS